MHLILSLGKTQHLYYEDHIIFVQILAILFTRDTTNRNAVDDVDTSCFEKEHLFNMQIIFGYLVSENTW